MRGTHRCGRRSIVALGLTVALLGGCAEGAPDEPVAVDTTGDEDADEDDLDEDGDADDEDADDEDAPADADELDVDEDDADDEPPPSFDDPPLIDGEPLAADAVSDDLVALLDEDLRDGEVCAALGLEEAQMRSLSLAGEGYDYLSEQSDLYDQVLPDRLWCFGPTSVGMDGAPLTTYGVGIEVFTFTPSEADTAFSADTVTTPGGRLALVGSASMDPSSPEANTIRYVSVFSVEHGVGLRATGNERSSGSSDEGLGALLDEVADRFA